MKKNKITVYTGAAGSWGRPKADVLRVAVKARRRRAESKRSAGHGQRS